MSDYDLIIRNAILDSTGEPVEVAIRGQHIAEVARDGLDATAVTEIDGGSAMVSPALLESHFHLENALLWEGALNETGTLEEAITVYADVKQELTVEDIVQRASQALTAAVANGTLWLRSHVDIDHIAGLDILRGVAAARDRFRHLIDVQLVAFPQLGLARNPQAVDLMWQAMEQGCDLVGGMPHGERNMKDAGRHIELAFEIAQHYDVDVDMHIDETDDPYWQTLELLADKTIECGWQGRVTAGHCCAMDHWDDRVAQRIIEKTAAAQIHVITNAPINLMLEGRNHGHPKPRGIARVKQLLQAGVNVVCGQDDLQNMFYPYGKMDPLEVALITAHAAHLAAPAEIQAAFDMPRYNAARLWRLPHYGLHPGAEANLILLDARSPVEALRRQPPRRYVIRRGQVLLHSETRTEWMAPQPGALQLI